MVWTSRPLNSRHGKEEDIQEERCLRDMLEVCKIVLFWQFWQKRGVKGKQKIKGGIKRSGSE